MIGASPLDVIANVTRHARTFMAISPEAPAPGLEDEYGQHSRETNVRNGRVFFLGTCVGNLLWWASDAAVYRGQPAVLRQFATFRPLISLSGLMLYALVTHATWARRWPVLMLACGGSAALSLTAFGLSGLGPPSQPWFHYLHLAPPATVLVSCPFGPRLATILAVAAAAVLAYFAPHRSYWNDPNALAAVSFFGFSCAASLVAGVNSERTRRATFFVKEMFAGRSRELRELSEQLEQRVAAQTAELRALASYLESAREEERARMARELHDELGQELTSARYVVATLRRRQGSLLGHELEELEETLARTVKATREIVADLRPQVLESLGLVASLGWLARRAEARSDVRCELEVVGGGDEGLPTPLVTAAFRIAQESLTNVSKHAGARRVILTLRRDEESLQIQVRDDGQGFDTLAASVPRASETGGFGLLGLRERARALGGVLSVESTPGGGTSVLATLPLHRAGKSP